MWVASILQVLALGAVDPAAPLAASAAPAPIYWRQTLFSIPFHVERPNQPGQEPVQVQLYVSPDRGRRWDNWRQAEPQAGHFLFRAGADGEYWFDVRTLDRSGQVRPQGPHTPKLIVIVDTVPPKAQIAAVRGDAGQITATFHIEELYPNLDSLAIEYRLASTAAWQIVPIGPKNVRSNNAEHQGEVTWYPQNATGTMEIRLRVSDMAGNPAESHFQLVLPAAGSAAAANPVRPPSGIADIPAGTNPLGPRTPIAPAATMAPASLASSTTAVTLPVSAGPAEPWPPLDPPTSRTSWPAENANPSSADAGRSLAFQNDPSSASVAVRFNPPVTNQLVSDRQIAPAGPSAPVNPFNGFAAARPTEPATNPAIAGDVGPPPGVPLRWINTRVFQLDYDTRVLGGMANMPVELWGTRDGGKTWQSFGRDPKGQSPMLVTVPEEGIYGFRMAVQNGPGTAGRPPLAGDVPGYWVGIDLTRPVGRITHAQQGVGRDADKLFIAWEASDNRKLAARPIALSYSERLGGPWTPLAGNLENTGQYAWQLTGSLPQRVYLRLEIHDAADNMGIYETPEPVSLDLSSPSAQLRDLRPLGPFNAPPAANYPR